jgi:hypothetical protein
MSKAYKTDADEHLPLVNTSKKKRFIKMPMNTHGKDEVARTTPYNGWANYKTWEVANAISNNEYLHDLCRHFYLNGYKTYGALRCKLHEYGPKWKLDGITEIYWDHEDIRSKEITALMVDIFKNPKTTSTK